MKDTRIISSTTGKASGDRTSRKCIKCGETKPLSEYYGNRDWKEQQCKDIWCKECVLKCTTKDEVREYFWDNNKEWSPRIWNNAKAKAEKALADNEVYKKASDDIREGILMRLACQQIPTASMPQYKFVDNKKTGISYQEAKERGYIIEDEDPDIKIYSTEFNGHFKRSELVYLEKYYEELEKDFSFDNENLRDYARKLCKASLHANKAQDDFLAGKCDYSVVKDAVAQFDMLSKSANFAECRRKQDETSGVSSFSEQSYLCETNGHPATRKIEYPEDDVDLVMNDFRYMTTALGLNEV